MGRLNHENDIVVPGGWKRTAILTTDDTFSGPSAQLDMYPNPLGPEFPDLTIKRQDGQLLLITIEGT